MHAGRQSGSTPSDNTGGKNIAIGYEAGTRAGIKSSEQGNIAIGSSAGHSQTSYGVAIGYNAGKSQNDNAIAIGKEAAETNQSGNAIAIGTHAGENNQSEYSVALGYGAARYSQRENSIAIGNGAGFERQGESCIAIGRDAGRIDQSANSIIITSKEGGQTGASNQIIINSSNEIITPEREPGFYVKPVRQSLQKNTLYYDINKGEITYEAGTLATGTTKETNFDSSFNIPITNDKNITLVPQASNTGSNRYFGLKHDTPLINDTVYSFSEIRKLGFSDITLSSVQSNGTITGGDTNTTAPFLDFAIPGSGQTTNSHFFISYLLSITNGEHSKNYVLSIIYNHGRSSNPILLKLVDVTNSIPTKDDPIEDAFSKAERIF